MMAALAALAIIPFSGSVRGQTLHRIAVLSAGDRGSYAHLFAAFESGLRDLGYVAGSTISIEYRFADGKFAQLPALAAGIARDMPTVVLAHSTPAATAAKNAITNIPIVIVGVADPVGSGLVASLARPGGNVTGVTNISAELTGKRLAIIKELMPRLSSIAVILNPDDPNARLQMRNAVEAASSLGLRLQPVLELRKADDLETLFSHASKSGVMAAIRMVDPLINILRKPFVELAEKHRLPVIYAFREDAEAGGLISFGTSQSDQFRQASAFIDKILKGAHPRDLPVEQPTKFELVVNQKTARALGLTIPQSILLSANTVID
jgi:putative ABC transport system substrate-binding protein